MKEVDARSILVVVEKEKKAHDEAEVDGEEGRLVEEDLSPVSKLRRKWRRYRPVFGLSFGCCRCSENGIVCRSYQTVEVRRLSAGKGRVARGKGQGEEEGHPMWVC